MTPCSLGGPPQELPFHSKDVGCTFLSKHLPDYTASHPCVRSSPNCPVHCGSRELVHTTQGPELQHTIRQGRPRRLCHLLVSCTSRGLELGFVTCTASWTYLVLEGRNKENYIMRSAHQELLLGLSDQRGCDRREGSTQGRNEKYV
jgi:hypothetical protein